VHVYPSLQHFALASLAQLVRAQVSYMLKELEIASSSLAGGNSLFLDLHAY
jgi:hypothetical protein